MNVVAGGYAENLSIPIQQIAYVITNGRELKADEKELLEKVVDIEEVPSRYVSWLSDPKHMDIIIRIHHIGCMLMGLHKMRWE